MLVSQEKTRYECGVALAASIEILKMPKITNNQHWLLESESQADKFYDIVVTEEGTTCNCPDYELRNVVCKHCFAVIVKEGK